MAKNFYIGSGFTNQNADSAYDVYPITYIAPEHGLKTYRTLYSSLGTEACLALLDDFPENSTVVIDNEEPAHLYSWVNDAWVFNTVYRDAMIAEIGAYRTARPDCTYGYDNRWPEAAYYLYNDSHLDAYASLFAWFANLVIPLVAEVDFLIPSISISTSAEPAYMHAEVLRKQVLQCRQYFPSTPIIPMLRPYYITPDLAMQSAATEGGPTAPGNYGVPYLDADIANSNMSGTEWQVMLDMLDELELEEFIMWSEGNRPWGLVYDWCTRTIKWKNSDTVDVKLNTIIAKTDTIGVGTFAVLSPLIGSGETIDLVYGDDYSATHGNSIDYVSTTTLPGSISKAFLIIKDLGTTATIEGTVLSTTSLRFETTSTVTSALSTGIGSYAVQLKFTDNKIRTISTGTVQVRKVT